MKRKININIKRFVETISGAALTDGLVPENSWPEFAQERGGKQMIVVAAAPRTGSTFLANTLSQLTGFKYFRLCTAYSTNEHDLYLPALCLMNRYGCVSQLHMKGSFHNAALLKAFGIRPLILVRNIEDIAVSLARDLRIKEEAVDYGTGRMRYSFLWQDRCTKELDDEGLLDFVIDLAIPWYVNFYVSWYRLIERNDVEALWITYESLMQDKESTLQEVLGFLGLDSKMEISQDLLERRYATFGGGGNGGDEAALNSAQKQRIRQRFSYYSDVDFSRYGL